MSTTATTPLMQRPEPPVKPADPRLAEIRRKVEVGERLGLDEGRVLYDTPDIWTVLELADLVRRRLHGDAAYYNVNRHLNYSNVCALSCKFCDFYAKKGDRRAYTRDLAFIRDEAARAVENGATEMHIVGGLHPYEPFSYYTEMLSTIREAAPRVHLKAFTAVEIVHLCRIAKVYRGSSREERRGSIRWVLERLREAGLGSLPGGGAEVFDDRVHDEAFKGKIRSDVWLDVHDVAHEMGINSNATMLYGHVETRDDRLTHMDMLRRAQDRSLARLGYDTAGEGAVTLTRPDARLPAPTMNSIGGYFQTIIPLPFIPDGSALDQLPGPSGLENYRTLAVARLMLDNFPHVKAFWIMQTLPLAQVMLQSGADDIDGTVVWYDITHVGGSTTHQEVTVAQLCKAIREAGFRPVERDTLYRRVVRSGREWRVEGE